MKPVHVALIAVTIALPTFCPSRSMADTCTAATVTTTPFHPPQSSIDRFIDSHQRYVQPSATARLQMSDALTVEHRKIFASLISDLTTSPAPNAATAMQQFDVVLAASERQQIVAAQARYDEAASGNPSYPAPRASAAVLLLGATLYGPGGALMYTDSYLLHASGASTSSQTFGGCQPSPPASVPQPSPETPQQAALHLKSLRSELKDVYAEERRQMIGALSPVHRQQFGAIVGAMAIAQNLDTATAGRQIDAMLSRVEGNAILQIADSSSERVNENQFEQTREMQAEAGIEPSPANPQHVEVRLPKDPAAALLTTTLAVSFSLHNGPQSPARP